jgi:hypothetical protein
VGAELDLEVEQPKFDFAALTKVVYCFVVPLYFEQTQNKIT